MLCHADERAREWKERKRYYVVRGGTLSRHGCIKNYAVSGNGTMGRPLLASLVPTSELCLQHDCSCVMAV